MSIYRIFIRHESEAQPTWFKLRSEKTQEELVADIHASMEKQAPALLQFTDLDQHTWLFRADKIYTVCVYPAETDPTGDDADAE